MGQNVVTKKHVKKLSVAEIRMVNGLVGKQKVG